MGIRIGVGSGFGFGWALRLVAVLAVISAVTLTCLRLSGDPVALIAPMGATAGELASLRHQMGYDLPFWSHYLRFVRKVAVGDFGCSTRSGRPALDVVLERVPATLELMGWSFLLAALLSIPLGVAWSTSRGLGALAVDVLTGLRLSIPSFWLGSELILLFSVRFGLLPSGGQGGVTRAVLPIATLATYHLCRNARLLRGLMAGVIHEDYLTVAAAKGLSRNAVLYKHALANCVGQLTGHAGAEIGSLLAGAVVVETVFAWPGIGRLMAQSVQYRDFPVVLAAVMISSLALLLADTLADAARRYADPRLRDA